MAPRTLAHHRKSDNRYSFGFGRQTITLTRRFLPNRSVRVRVTSETVSGEGEGNWTDYRDFTDMHEGDAAYAKQARRLCTQWEERYCSTTPKKKETSVSDEPTQEPTQEASADADRQPTATQWQGGATLTPARAAELATRRTGVQHVVSADGKTLCRAEPATPNRRGTEAILANGQAVTEGEVTGRILGEWTIKTPGRRMGRSDAMLLLLKAQTAHLRAADMATHALRVKTETTPADRERAADAQVKATYFRALRDAGYAADTTWDELVDMLRPVLSTALHGMDDQRAALPRVKGAGRASMQRSIEAAELFITACKPILYFFQDSPDA